MNPQLLILIDAVTATTTSAPVDIKGVKRITLALTRANHSSGSSALGVEVSLDGTNWVTFNKLITNVTNTNAQTLTRVASVSQASNGTAIATMDLEKDVFSQMRVTATETTDGTHTVKAFIEYLN